MKLLIAEKRDAAEKIAAAAGWQKQRGYYEGRFNGDTWRVVWASGHLITLKSPKEINPETSWDNPATLVPIPQSFPLKVIPDSPGRPAAAQPSNYLKNIQYHLKDAREVVIGTDADREGEAIGWTIIEWLGWRGPVSRAWFAAGLDKKSLTEALNSLRPPERTKGWYRASEARRRSDWAFMNLVVAYTFYASYNKFGENLGKGSGREAVMSVGRVQTPTLALIVRRDREIHEFVARDHYKVAATFRAEANATLVGNYKPKVTQALIDSQPQGVYWQPSTKVPKEGEPDPLDIPLFTDRQLVDAFEKRLGGQRGSVVSFVTGTKNESPEKTFSLSDAQIAIGNACKISANLAQVVLEDLYEQGYTSYARTAKTDLPANLYEAEERNGVLAALIGIPELTEAAKRAKAIHDGNDGQYAPFMPAVFTTKNLEHHGIIPTKVAMTPAALQSMNPKKASDRGRVEHTAEHMQVAYKLIAKQYVRALFPACVYETQKAEIEVNVRGLLGEDKSRFTASGKRLVDPGWRAAFQESATEDAILPSLQTRADVGVEATEVSASKTTPPKRYTEATLPKAMENIAKEVRDPSLRRTLRQSEGIGTPATRKEIISTLIARGYIEVKKSAYYSTSKGRDVIAHVESWLASPEETAQWEDYLVKICEETNDARAIAMRDRFVQAIIGRVEELIRNMMERFQGELGQRNRRLPNKVTPAMQAAIKKVASTLDIGIPSGALSKVDLAVAFLDEHKSKMPPDDGKPSEAQIGMLDAIKANPKAGIEVPADAYLDRKTCSAFLDKHIGKRAPTEGQLKFAKMLASELPEDRRPDESVFATAASCSTFIDKHKKGGSKGKAKSSPAKRGRSTQGSRGSTRRA